MVTKRTRAGETITYCYDNLNRLAKKLFSTTNCSVTTGGTYENTEDVFYGYDLMGHRLTADFLSATGSGVGDAYDVMGRLTSETTAIGGVSNTVNYQSDQAAIRPGRG